MKNEFERTTCGCAACVQCCKDQPGPLAPGDLERIAEFLGKPVRDVLCKFWASPGAVLRSCITGEVYRVGTITPQRREGRCVFLDEDDHCSIHSVAPFGCAYFDMHQPPAEYHKRGAWFYREIQSSRAYELLRAMLPPATSWRPKVGAL